MLSRCLQAHNGGGVGWLASGGQGWAVETVSSRVCEQFVSNRIAAPVWSANDWPALTSFVLIFNLSGRRMTRGENELLCCSCADRDSDGFKGNRFKLYERFRAERWEFEERAKVVLSRHRSRSSGLWWMEHFFSFFSRLNRSNLTVMQLHH